MILWKETLQVNALRLACAVVVWLIIGLLLGETEFATGVWFLPVFYVGLACIVMLGRSIAPANPLVLFLGLMATITIAVADPLMFALRLAFPSLVPMRYYYPLMGAYFLYVYEEESKV